MSEDPPEAEQLPLGLYSLRWRNDLIVCRRCGNLIGDVVAHDEWHDEWHRENP